MKTACICPTTGPATRKCVSRQCCDAYASSETRVPVDHHQLAVRAVVHAAESGPVRLVIAKHLSTGVAQHLQIAPVHLRRAHPVQQHMHRHSGACLVGKRLRHLFADLA